jgi:DNA-binding transcriptional LysR family regulator
MLNEIDLSRADLNLFVVFETVLAEGHVGRAAERLSLSPSAVSHGLTRLRRLLNDPLFLRTPKGVVPTARALELAGPIAEVLMRAKIVIQSADPFEAAKSTRRFTIGAPDAVSAVVLQPLLARLRRVAPGIDIGLRQLLPPPGRMGGPAWDSALADLEARAMDIAILPIEGVPARFAEHVIYEEDFVIAMRTGHAFAESPTLKRYCEMQHLVVSLAGDPHGFVDQGLEALGRSRRVALTVSNFMMALAIVADSDLITALPRRFAAMYGRRYKITTTEAPLRLPRFKIRAITPKAAMMDAGIAWLFGLLQHCTCSRPAGRRSQ